MLANTDIAQIAAELTGTHRLTECYDVSDRWLPRSAHADHFNYLFANLRTGSFIRRPSPGFPAGVYAEYSPQAAKNDLILRLARSSAPGSCFHLTALRKHPNKPKGWDELVKRTADDFGLIDSITIVLFFDKAQQCGLAMTCWREKPHLAFSAEDFHTIELIAPAFANTFARAFAHEYDNLARNAQTNLLAGANQFMFFVSAKGDLRSPDPQVQSCLKPIFGNSVGRSGLPRELSGLVIDLIGKFERTPGDGLTWKDVAKNDQSCRVYLSRVEAVPEHDVAYKVVVDCSPESFSFSMLAEEGLTEIQIQLVELLQAGIRNIDIANTLGTSLGNVNYHIEKIGEKVDAAGRTEILSRAMSLRRKILVSRGLVGPQIKTERTRQPVPPSSEELAAAPA